MELLDALRSGVVGGERQVDPAELGELRGQVARGAVQVRHRLAGVDPEERRGFRHQLAEATRAFRRQRGRVEARLLVDQRDEEPDEIFLFEAGASDRGIGRIDLGDTLGHRLVNGPSDVPGG